MSYSRVDFIEMDVVMPVQEGRCLPFNALRSLSSQGYAIRLWVSTQYSQANIATARNNVKKYGATDCVLMLDNDIAIPDGALKRMCNFMDIHNDFGAIALPKDNVICNSCEVIETDHVDMSCVLFKRQILKQVVFKQDSGICECLHCARDVRKMGFRIGFLTGIKVDHLPSTRYALHISDDSVIGT